jgi:peptide chain release factor subunit 1
MNSEPTNLQHEVQDLLQELLDLEDSASLFLTLYLDTSVSSAGQRHYPVYLKQKSADLTKILAGVHGPQAVPEFLDNLAKMERYLNEELGKNTRGVALFSSQERGYFRALELPLPVRNKFAASHAPNLDVLIELLQQYPHFCVVSFDQQTARILSVYLSDVIGKSQLESQEAAATARSSGSSPRLRYEQRLRDHVQHFLREVAAAIERLMREEKPQGLILLATQSNISELRRHLSPDIDRQIVLTQSISPDTPDSQMVARVLDAVQKSQREQARQILEELYERLSQDYMAVAGIEPTLLSLQIGQVQTLILSARFDSTGRRCSRCGSLFPDPAGPCGYCQGETIPVDLRDRMEKLAEQQKVRIEIISERSFVDSLGGTAALLSF